MIYISANSFSIRMDNVPWRASRKAFYSENNNHGPIMLEGWRKCRSEGGRTDLFRAYGTPYIQRLFVRAWASVSTGVWVCDFVIICAYIVLYFRILTLKLVV